METDSNKLHIAIDCGRMDRVIESADLHTVEIGCFSGTKAEAIAEIRKKYEGQEADDYIQKVRECFEGTDDPDKIRHYATHFDWQVRWVVARQGFELERLKHDHDWMVRWMAEHTIDRMSNKRRTWPLIAPKR